MTSKKVVAIGGGHGLSITLQAVRQFTDKVTAIASVADDGGSSGRLRDTLGIAAPGDIRRCLVALADRDSELARSFDKRFANGELAGHAFGNLVIAGLIQHFGDFVSALDEVGRLLGCVGRVLPATDEPVRLKAITQSESGPTEVHGQVAVSKTSPIVEIALTPTGPKSPAAVPKAIHDADVVVLGPGSLFTSVLAACVVPDIRDALEKTSARRVYVCNLWPQHAETMGFNVADHVQALNNHGIFPDAVVYDPKSIEVGELPIDGFSAALANADGTAHDASRLSDVLSGMTK